MDFILFQIQSALIKKAEDTEDTAEQSAIRLRQQQSQTSNALVVTEQSHPNGTLPVGQLSLVKIPSMSSAVVCCSLCFVYLHK